MTGAGYGLMIVPIIVLLAGHGVPERKHLDTPTATATVTVTSTPTEAPTVGPELIDGLFPSDAAATGADGSEAALPRLELRVFSDGCGVIRSRPPKGVTFHDLTWTFRDPDGFQVLGRNALCETRYRYYLAGSYTVVLEAWTGDRYTPVSNRVTVHC